ncbi:hypothetical protein D3C85_1521270 [compost metagenome]
MVGDQCAGRSIRIGQDFNIEPGIVVKALGLSHKKADVVCVGRPVEGDGDGNGLGEGRRCAQADGKAECQERTGKGHD